MTNSIITTNSPSIVKLASAKLVPYREVHDIYFNMATFELLSAFGETNKLSVLTETPNWKNYEMIRDDIYNDLFSND